jgi:hypothetical protein
MVDRYVVVDTVSGRTAAGFVQSFLRARGIKCEISQEAAGWVHGLGLGPMAEAEIMVPSHQAKEARRALKDYHKKQPR